MPSVYLRRNRPCSVRGVFVYSDSHSWVFFYWFGTFQSVLFVTGRNMFTSPTDLTTASFTTLIQYYEGVAFMLGRTHSIAGVASGLALSHFIAGQFPAINEYAVMGIVTASALVGSLAPDIDIEQSTFSKRVPILSIPYKLIAKLPFKCFQHRGITHSLLFPLIFVGLCLYFTEMNHYIVLALLGLTVGTLSHIILDMLNYKGVAIFSPIWNKMFHLTPYALAVEAGSFGEAILRVLLWIGVIWYVAFVLFAEQTAEVFSFLL